MFNLSLCHHGDEAITAVTIFPGRWLCALVLSALLWSGPLLANGAAIEPGHSGHWYDPQRSGEGWVLEVLDAERVLAYWFTYDEEGRQRWLMGMGGIVRDQAGDRIHFGELYDTRGGRFGPDFDPADVVRQVVGQATFRFADCARGDVEFQAYGQNGRHELHRLGRVMGAGCAPRHGLPGRPVLTHAGQSGSWYDPAHAGEGYTLQWLDDGRALVVWFSYDAEGRQYWMLGMGERDGERLRIPELHATRGARFGDQFDPEDVERFAWGQLDLDLGCDGGPADYASPLPGFGSGRLALARLTRLHRLACPTVAPTLSELYRFELIEVPLNRPDGPENTQILALADDSTVLASQATSIGIRLLRWRPGMTQMQVIPLDPTLVAFSLDRAEISSDAQRMAITAVNPASQPRVGVPMLGSQNGTWTAPTGLTFESSFLYGMSRDGSRLVGRGMNPSQGPPERAWIWDNQRGQVSLRLAGAMLGANAMAVSNDGRIAAGYHYDNTNPNQPDGVVRYFATRWFDEDEPEILRDIHGHPLWMPFACSTDGQIIVGASQGGDLDPTHPQLGQAWYWTERTSGVYLGQAPDGVPTSPYYAADVSADGSLIIGNYLAELADGDWSPRAFIWTQATGMEPISALLAEHEPGDDDWNGQEAFHISSAGDLILLFGYRHGEDVNPTRASLLRLSPRDPD